MKKHVKETSNLKFHEELESKNIYDIKIKKSKMTYRELSIVGYYTFELIRTHVHLNNLYDIFFFFWSIKKHVKETQAQIS